MSHREALLHGLPSEGSELQTGIEQLELPFHALKLFEVKSDAYLRQKPSHWSVMTPHYNGAVHERALVGGRLCFPPTERASNTRANTKLRSAVRVRADNFDCC